MSDGKNFMQDQKISSTTLLCPNITSSQIPILNFTKLEFTLPAVLSPRSTQNFSVAKTQYEQRAKIQTKLLADFILFFQCLSARYQIDELFVKIEYNDHKSDHCG